METISFEEFKKIDMRVGKIVSAEKVEGSATLLKLIVEFGQTKKQIISGIGKCYTPETLVGRECPFVFNLEPKVLKGIESQGMMLCVDDGGSVLLHPEKGVVPGSIVL